VLVDQRGACRAVAHPAQQLLGAGTLSRSEMVARMAKIMEVDSGQPCRRSRVPPQVAGQDPGAYQQDGGLSSQLDRAFRIGMISANREEVMRRFLLDCRRAATARGLPVTVVFAAFVGVHMHHGVVIDFLAAAACSCLIWAIALPGYVVGRRLCEARRRP
jgi:hypothetical protein